MIDVQYRCATCSSGWRVVPVADRKPDQGVVDWVRGRVVVAIQADHSRRSPFCRATEISETKIPIPADEGGRIGDPTKH